MLNKPCNGFVTQFSSTKYLVYAGDTGHCIARDELVSRIGKTSRPICLYCENGHCNVMLRIWHSKFLRHGWTLSKFFCLWLYIINRITIRHINTASSTIRHNQYTTNQSRQMTFLNVRCLTFSRAWPQLQEFTPSFHHVHWFTGLYPSVVIG